jgi:hypothetical protein
MLLGTRERLSVAMQIRILSKEDTLFSGVCANTNPKEAVKSRISYEYQRWGEGVGLRVLSRLCNLRLALSILHLESNKKICIHACIKSLCVICESNIRRQ